MDPASPPSLPSPTSPAPALTFPIPLTTQSSASTLQSSLLPSTPRDTHPNPPPPSHSTPSVSPLPPNPSSTPSTRRPSLISSVVVPIPSIQEEKSYNPALNSLYQTKAQELSLRINSLTARRRLQVEETKAIDDPEALTRDLSHLEKEELETTVHFLPLPDLVLQLHSDLKAGLTLQQVAANRGDYGVNVVSPAGEISYILLFAQQLVTGFNALLWIATIVIFLSWQPLGSLNGLVPAAVNVAVAALLLVVIFVQAVFNLYMVVGAINIVRSFAAIKLGHVRVTRAGLDSSVPAEELVVGDLVHVELGQRIPADIRLIDCHDLHVDNSALTGESELVQCTHKCTSVNFMDSRNMVFLGTACPQGGGRGLVVATGDQAVIGQINSLTQSSNDNFDTSLHREIIRFVTIVACAALTTGSIALIVWGAWLYQDHATFMPPAAIILNVISLIVAYVPEGLPVTVTLTLVLIAKRMYAQNVLVRNLAIVETFNSLSLIATDKTGTLTQNKMTITQLAWGLHQQYTPAPVDDPADTRPPLDLWKALPGSLKDDEAFQALILGGALCNSSSIQTGEDGALTVLGDAADTALHTLLAAKLHVDPVAVRASYPRLAALPFNSKNKFMIVCHRVPDTLDPTTLPLMTGAGGQVVCFLKGAPEVVLQRCSSAYMDGEGVASREVPLTEEVRQAVLDRQDSMGRSGLRVIAMCRLVLPSTAYDKAYGAETGAGGADLDRLPNTGFTFVGMYGLLDPPRERVAESIQKAHLAGVRVAMLTGDHATTAVSIARQVHIIPAQIAEAEVYTLRMAQDSLGRACVDVMQGGEVRLTHVLGQAKPAPAVPDTPEPRTRVGRVGAYVRTSLVSKPIEPRLVTTATAAVVTGSDLRVFDEWLWDWALHHRYLVFARTTPEQKLKIVGEAQLRHEVVAVTGDGVSDSQHKPSNCHRSSMHGPLLTLSPALCVPACR